MNTAHLLHQAFEKRGTWRPEVARRVADRVAQRQRILAITEDSSEERLGRYLSRHKTTARHESTRNVET